MAEATWKIQEIPPDKLIVNVTIGANGVEEELKSQLDRARRTTHVDGFRKGRTPDKILMQRHGQALLDATRDNLLRQAVKVVSATILARYGVEKAGETPIEDARDAVFSRKAGLTFSLWLTAPVKSKDTTSGIGDGTVVDFRKPLLG